jgi:4-hydroxybenzoate polyprenyltransferase
MILDSKVKKKRTKMNYNKSNSFSIIKFIKLGKPHLVGSLFFYFSIGALLAVLFNAPFVLSKFILGWIIIFLSGWAVHYHNDYFDFETDHNTKPLNPHQFLEAVEYWLNILNGGKSLY